MCARSENMHDTTRTLAATGATSLVALTAASAEAATVTLGATGVNPGGGSGAGTVATASVDGTSSVNFT